MISCPANGSVDDVHPTAHPSIDDPLATNRLIERRLRILYYHHTSGPVRPCVRVCCVRARACVCVCTCGRDHSCWLARACVCVPPPVGIIVIIISSSTSTSTHNIILHLQSSVPCVVLRVRVCSVSVRFFLFLFFFLSRLSRCDRNVNFFLLSNKICHNCWILII